MDMRQIIAVFIAMSVAVAGATIINVVVNDRIKYVVDYTKTVSGNYWKFLGNVENTGSVACPARMKLETRDGKFWTEQTVIEPGEIKLFRIPYVTNETEYGNVTIYFCDRVEKIGEYEISPTSLTKANSSATATIYGKTAILRADNMTFIPLGAKNFVMPITHVSGEKQVEFQFPGNFTGKLRFLVFNSTNYDIIEAKRKPDMGLLKTITQAMIYMLIGLVAGRFLNGI